MMIRRRDNSLRRLGALLAALAVSVQLAFAGGGLLTLAAPGAAADPFVGHALCLAGGGQPAAPDNGAPAGPHVHDAFCCLAHATPALTPQAAFMPALVAYARIATAARSDDALFPAPPSGPGNARGPPFLT